MIHYLAYGSNLHPLRLIERVPSANFLETYKLAGHRLTFHKRSTDYSGKCDLVKTGLSSDVVYGAIYELDPKHKDRLDEFESKGNGYKDGYINLDLNGVKLQCFTYYAQETHIEQNLNPYHWYKNLVLLGARFHNFPEEYISSISEVQSIHDMDIGRNRKTEELIERIKKYR